MNRSLLTIATTKPIYFNMAVNLARSFLLWNRGSGIGFSIVTDLEVMLPADLKDVQLTHVAPGSLGSGFSPKLHLDRLAPARQTLFVDADCLCLGSVAPVFERFRGRAVSVVGGSINAGEWFGDVASICAHLSVPALPKFNGGIYYIEPGQTAAAVYQRARALEAQYDALGLVRLRGHPNEELLVAMSMAVEGIEGIPDDGTILGDLQSCQETITIDVLSGSALLRNPPAPDPRHQPWCELERVRPCIVHFLGHHVQNWRYRAEVLKLYMVSRLHSPTAVARMIGSSYSAPSRLGDDLKTRLRPVAHRYVGVRKIRAGVR